MLSKFEFFLFNGCYIPEPFFASNAQKECKAYVHSEENERPTAQTEEQHARPNLIFLDC